MTKLLLWLLLLAEIIFFAATDPIDNGLIGSRIIKECTARERVDLAVILDGSGSISDLGFEDQKNFLNLLLEDLNIGAEATRVAVVQFADQPRLEIRFGAHSSKLRLQGAVARLSYLTGSTLTGRALSFALNFAFAEARGGDVPKVLLVLTDGQSQDDVSHAAAELREADVLVYAVGVSDLVDGAELAKIAGSPQRVFTVRSYDALGASLASLIVKEMCGVEFLPGAPEIICEADGVGVRARSKRPFHGSVFVKGHYHEEGCRLDSPAFVHNPTRLELRLALSSCGVRRFRSLEPRGVFVETTIVFMFHTWFMTKVDQAVHIQCFYMEADKTVDVPLEVSMLTTEFAERIYPMPRCFYSLRSGSPDGAEIHFARVGDKVFHRWECIEHTPTYDVFGMLVHDCVVDDSEGDSVRLIDSQGCGGDAHLVATPDYDSSLRVAVTETHVFKYADRPVLLFQCQITICYKHDGGCQDITPPSCSEESRRRRRRSGGMKIGGGAGTLDVAAPQIQVMDSPSLFAMSSAQEESSASNRLLAREENLCANVWALVYALATLLSVMVVLVVAAAYSFVVSGR